MTTKKAGHIESFLQKANQAIDSALDQGVKKADKILDEAMDKGKITANEAIKVSEELRKHALKESKKLKEKGEKQLNKGISAAKSTVSNRNDTLDALAKLGELRKAEVITDREFREKKKKLLAQI